MVVEIEFEGGIVVKIEIFLLYFGKVLNWFYEVLVVNIVCKRVFGVYWCIWDSIKLI